MKFAVHFKQNSNFLLHMIQTNCLGPTCGKKKATAELIHRCIR